MGLIVDASVLIPAERNAQNAPAAIADLLRCFPGEDLAVSVVTVVELAHRVARSNTPAREQIGRQFLLELRGAMSVDSVTTSIVLSAGRMDGDCTAWGVRIALPDLLIGATARELGYRVATISLRHFR